MSAQDYKICPALGSAYIARVSKKNEHLMTEDRREIREGEILMLVDWYLDYKCGKDHNSVTFDSQIKEGKKIQIKYI